MSGRLFAAPGAPNSRLLIIFLRGAYDATNVIVPSSSDYYYEARPHIAIPRPDSDDVGTAIPLDSDWSLHPALRASILPLWQKKQIAFIPFAGTHDTSRSHFETQDLIELGQPSASRDFGTGFMARLADILKNSRPISFSQELPLCFRGSDWTPNVDLTTDVRKMRLTSGDMALIAGMYQGQAVTESGLENAVREGFDTRIAIANAVREESEGAGRNATSASGFEASVRYVAALMKSQNNLDFLDVGGWDMHVNAGGVNGRLADRIGKLGSALAAFANEIGPSAWDSTTVVVLSEFGRTFRENGARGTDHGHGSIYWVLGGSVKGGRIAGDQIEIKPDTLHEGRDLPVLTEYRELLAGLIFRQFGLSVEQMEIVFPKARPVNLGIL